MDTPDILFEYLKDVVYNTEKARLDIEQLPADFQKLGQAMELVGKWIGEARKFSASIARGDLTFTKVDTDNVFLAPMKELQAILRHLAWQTQQVAKGDYTQKVEFMGDFSEAFNTMTNQLQERRDALIAQKQRVEEKNAELEQTFELAVAFSQYTHNMIFIYSSEGNGELFRNEFASWFLQTRPADGALLLEKLESKNMEAPNNAVTWELEIPSGMKQEESEFFNVETHPTVWHKEKALVHIIVDDTERKRKENLMYRLAYADALTGAFNQRYAKEYMQSLIEQGTECVISFVDVDYLKYCNDTLGHKGGDAYLIEVAKTLESLGGKLCRIGGDEFMLIETQRSVRQQNAALEAEREQLQRAGKDRNFPQSFSYASCKIPAHPEKPIEEYIAQVDSLMYQYKAMYKTPIADLLYRDDRVPDGM